ncbi:MAG TPA: hypothetical protein VIS48_06045 [Candidatus Kryptonia bacterium]
MKTTFAALSLLMLAGRCPAQSPEVGAKYKSGGATVEVVENGASCRLEYKSQDVLLDETNQRADIEMWDPEKTEEERSAIPLGGCIIVHVSDSTIDGANTKYWEYVLQTTRGKRILVQRGKDEIPEHTVMGSVTIWWNIDTVYLSDKLSSSIKVFVIDNLRQKRSAFIISPQ